MMRQGVHARVAAPGETALRRTAGRGTLAVMGLIAWCWLSVAPCHGEMIYLGQAGDFGVLGLTGTHITISGSSGVTGNLGVGPNGSGKFSGSTLVTGATRVDPTAGIKTSGSASINPTVTDLTAAVYDAFRASAQIAALAPTQTFGGIQGSQTITGNGGTNVISAQSIHLSGTFTLSGKSAITLSGGVDPANVHFNILGTEKVGTVK
jgi:hypothetical protein